jgi:hypothetical protein
MGIDRFAHFISKSINNDGFDEININNNIRKIITNHIIFDLNFLIYQEMFAIENEINDIIKIILCLPFVCDNMDILEKYLKLILNQPQWKDHYNDTNINLIFDGFNEDEIIQKFILFIMSDVKYTLDLKKLGYSILLDNDIKISVIELVIYEKIVAIIIDMINKIHYTQFMQSISIFFDGIPSYSKILEQRKRRIKNYLESIKKKEFFKQYFNNLETNNKKLIENLSKKYDITCDLLVFDYFKWIKYRFTLDKSIGPSSNFIKNLELFINIKLKQHFSKCNIYINSSIENGESDLKIFKYIANKQFTGECSIHTSDSDLIHHILVQQTYYKIIDKNINLNVIKYIKNNNIDTFIQVFEAPLIIKTLLELYNSINNVKNINYYIIWDLCLLFFLFGNDHLPSSVEIGPELGIEFFCITHYQSLNKNNIIQLTNSQITIDINHLRLYLETINKTKDNNITIIILQRFFKVSSIFINIVINTFHLNYNTLNSFLKKFIIYKSLLMTSIEFDNLDEDDLRKILNVNITNPEDYLNLSIFEFTDSQLEVFNTSIQIIEDNIDYTEKTFNGLVLYAKHTNSTFGSIMQVGHTDDPYQDLYNYVIDLSMIYLNTNYNKYYNYNNITTHLQLVENLNLCDKDISDSNNYLKKLYHLVTSQFGNMCNFNSNNTTYYKYYKMPSLQSIIQFILTSDKINLCLLWDENIKNNNVENYFNSTSHYLLITPFIFTYNTRYDLLSIAKELSHIENLWIIDDIANFNYRNINILDFMNAYNTIHSRDNLTNNLINIRIN